MTEDDVPLGKKSTSLKSLKKEVGSGSISESYGSDLHQNVTDPQHWQIVRGNKRKGNMRHRGQLDLKERRDRECTDDRVNK